MGQQADNSSIVGDAWGWVSGVIGGIADGVGGIISSTDVDVSGGADIGPVQVGGGYTSGEGGKLTVRNRGPSGGGPSGGGASVPPDDQERAKRSSRSGGDRVGGMPAQTRQMLMIGAVVVGLVLLLR